MVHLDVPTAKREQATAMHADICDASSSGQTALLWCNHERLKEPVPVLFRMVADGTKVTFKPIAFLFTKSPYLAVCRGNS